MGRKRASFEHAGRDRKSTRLNSSHTVIYTFPYTTLFRSPIISLPPSGRLAGERRPRTILKVHGKKEGVIRARRERSEEHTSELQSHSDLHFSLHDALPISDHFAATKWQTCGGTSPPYNSEGSWEERGRHSSTPG